MKFPTLHRLIERQTKKSHSLAFVAVAVFAIIALTACDKLMGQQVQDDGMVSLSYSGINHTDTTLVNISLNGGLVPTLYPKSGGAAIVCCISLPRKWHPGLKVKISWEHDGYFKKDKNGRLVLDKYGDEILIRSPRITKLVPVEPYDDKNIQGMFYVHFLPNDQVLAKASWIAPNHPDYRPEFPE